MTQGTPWKHILFFSLPILGGMILQLLYTTVDGIVVGNFVGEQALGAMNTSISYANVLLAISTGLSTGCGIIISSVTTKYRDLVMLVGFGLQLWQYGSPIAYGLQLIPEKWMGLYMLNPVTPIITTFRYGMFGFGFFDLTYFLIGWAVSIAVFFIGLILFSRIERTFMDTI